MEDNKVIEMDKGLTIGEVIHDDNAQVDAILKAHNIMSQKDLWHKRKNVMGKFKELLQEKRRTPKESTVEAATTIAQVAVFSIVQLKEYCREHDLPQSGSKLQLVQRMSVHLKLPEAGASPDIQRQRPLKYPKLAAHDIAYKLKSWIYTCAKNAALRYVPSMMFILNSVESSFGSLRSHHSNHLFMFVKDDATPGLLTWTYTMLLTIGLGITQPARIYLA
ncbi:hypothetical protein R1flu_005715 [Riccia fluitans]|uniref:SAP domain-containing protein n=1 Tax=Riccia fluitans TaxID=41844 RepID=A0ABD1YUJ5_9MARC